MFFYNGVFPFMADARLVYSLIFLGLFSCSCVFTGNQGSRWLQIMGLKLKQNNSGVKSKVRD